MIKQRLIAMGYKAWIDIEQLESGGAGLFEEIAEVCPFLVASSTESSLGAHVPHV